MDRCRNRVHMLGWLLVLCTEAGGCCLGIPGANASSTGTGSGSTGSGVTSGSTSSGGGGSTGAQCVIAGQPFPARATNPTNAAECCNPAISPSGWLPLFTKTQSFPVGSPAISYGNNDAMLGDLNGDSVADALLTAYVGESSISQGWAYLSSPQGFQGPIVCGSQESGEVWPGSPAIGDIDGDGRPDVLMSTDDSVEVFLGEGNGQFGPEIFTSLGGSCFGAWLKVADVNADGWPDVIASTGRCGLQILLNDGKRDGILLPDTSLAGYPGGHIAAGDFNDDGFVDISFVDVNGELQWIPGSDGGLDTLGTRGLAVSGTWGQATFPFNGADALATATSSALVVFLPGDGGPQLPASYPIDVGTGDVQTGDLDGDGRPDIVVASGWGGGQALDVFIDTGDGRFGIAGDFPVPGAQNIQRIALGDLNGDGALDLGVFRGGGPWEVWVNTCGPGAAQSIRNANGNQ